MPMQKIRVRFATNRNRVTGAALFGSLAPAVIASESRGILAGGPAEVADRIQARLDQLEEAAHG